LTGGSSDYEELEISSISGTTVTFYGTIQGLLRTEMIFDVGYPPLNSNIYAGFGSGGGYVVVANCYLESAVVLPPAYGTNLILNNPSTSGSLYINCTFVCDMSTWSNWGGGGGDDRSYTYYNAASSTGGGADFYNCRFHAKIGGLDYFGWDYTTIGNGYGGNHRVYNSIFTGEVNGEYTSGNIALMQVGFSNGYTPGTNTYSANTSQINNAYYNITIPTGPSGYSNDPYAITQGIIPRIIAQPPPSSPLLSTNNQQVFSEYTLRYDALFNPRSTTTPAVGPFEPYTGIESGSVDNLYVLDTGRFVHVLSNQKTGITLG